MSRTIVDIALVTLNSVSQGAKVLQTIVSMSITKNDPKAMVKTMRAARRGLGYTRGVPEYGCDLEVVLYPTDPEVDWDFLQQSGEVFGITYERNEGGQRMSLIDCIVGDVTEPYKEDGETRMSVKIQALDHRAE